MPPAIFVGMSNTGTVVCLDRGFLARQFEQKHSESLALSLNKFTVSPCHFKLPVVVQIHERKKKKKSFASCDFSNNKASIDGRARAESIACALGLDTGNERSLFGSELNSIFSCFDTFGIPAARLDG